MFSRLSGAAPILALEGVTALLLACALAGGVFVAGESANAAAWESFDHARIELLDERADNASARTALVTARKAAIASYVDGTTVGAIADPALLADAATLGLMETGIAALVSTARITMKEAGPTLPAMAPHDGYPRIAVPDDRDALTATATELTSASISLGADTAALRKSGAAIAEQVHAVTDAGLAVVASAFVRATTVSVPELASEASVEAYRVAVAALENPSPGVDLALLLQGYQNAFAAVVASHDEAVRSLEQAPLSPGATFIRGILIVNKTYSLPSSYGDGLTSETLAAFAAMQAEAAAAGHNLYISSGFRSFWSQQSIYNGLVSSVGQAAADRDTARPGHSEHQSGLTFDLNTIDEAFGTRPEGIWARDNAHRFGFVVRYPLGKEAITGYVWEPWHLRYLGVPVASELYSGGLTLEEYLGVTSVYAD